MPWAILDSSAYIRHWEKGLHEEELANIRKAFVIRHSAVVLSELRRGARTPAAQRLVEALFKQAHIQWEPTREHWWEAGKTVRKIADAQGWDKNKRRAFQNDTLIALTARSHGATVVTSDRKDFELLRREVGNSVIFL
jgi:predicted nucleic acid-binding protein